MTATARATRAASDEARPSTLAVIAHRLANVAFWPGVIGVLGVQIDLIPPIVAFVGFAITVLIGVIALIASLTTFALAARRNDAASREAAKLGLITGGLITLVAVAGIIPGIGAPPINDVTTNYERPPQFLAGRPKAGTSVPDMSYPAEFVPIAKAHYPDLQTAELRVPEYIAFYRVNRAALALGWQVVVNSPPLHSIEARTTSHIFRFVDDISIRIVASPTDPGVTLVDIRSRSRVGRSDLGANAARVRRFLDAL